MTVNDILLHKGSEVITIEPAATLAAAVRMLVQQRIGALLVTGADHRLFDEVGRIFRYRQTALGNLGLVAAVVLNKI